MRELVQPAATAVLTALMVLGACRERDTLGGSPPAVALAGNQAGACGADSLRPATAAPAPGLWLYERPPSERVAAMIGPVHPVDRDLVVARSVETVEATAAGDTIRHSAVAATVSLQILPPIAAPAAIDSASTDSAAIGGPAATYAVSTRVWLAAYEACDPSLRAPRLRYIRRDAAGRVVTDVLLHRTSE